MVAENIGLAGVRIEASVIDVTAVAAFYLPLEGLDLSHGYDASNNLKLADYSGGQWEVSGVYAANPTLQRMISVEGLPLHLHGFCAQRKQGGHVVRMYLRQVSERERLLRESPWCQRSDTRQGLFPECAGIAG